MKYFRLFLVKLCYLKLQNYLSFSNFVVQSQKSQHFEEEHKAFLLSDDSVTIVLILRRRYLYQLLTTYLPSMCLFFIIHATQYFKTAYFQTRIMVSLTGKTRSKYFKTLCSILPFQLYRNFSNLYAEVKAHTVLCAILFKKSKAILHGIKISLALNLKNNIFQNI